MDATTYRDLWGEHEEHPEKMYIWNEWGAIPCERDREGPALVLHNRVPGEGVRRQLFLLLDDNYFSLSTTITS